MSPGGQADYNALFEAKKNLPLRVRHILIRGLNKLDKKVVERELVDVRDSETLDDLRDRLADFQDGIRSLRVFKRCNVELIKPKNGAADQVDIVILIQERTYSAALEANASRGEMNAGMNGNLYNLLGRPNILSAEIQRGSLSSVVGRARLSFPNMLRIRDSLLSLEGFQSHMLRVSSAHTETTRGVSLSFFTGGAHTLALDGHWREIVPDVNEASLAIREFAGHSLKTSIRHEYRIDTRDHPFVPTSGFLFHNKAEYAGLHGDVRFCRNETHGQLNFPLPLGMAAHLACMAGILHTPKGIARSCISDRFFLGGSNSLRGFRTHAVGPEMNGQALGGELMGAASARLSTGFGFLPEGNLLEALGMRAFAFANAGNTMLRRHGAPRKEEAERFWGGVEASLGVGLAVPFPVGRVELNFCRPLRTMDGADGRVQNFQIGLGIVL
eukprot:tig00000802_g4279.t1